MIMILMVIFALIELFIGGFLMSRSKTSLFGFKIADNPQLARLIRSYSPSFLIFGIGSLVVAFLNDAIFAAIFLIAGMILTMGISFRFSKILKHLQ